MAKGKNIDTTKQENQSQDQFAAERLTYDELDDVAGGTGEEIIVSDIIINDSRSIRDFHCH